MSILKISLIQSNLTWENPDKNLQMFEKKITEIKRESDIVLLPEMFTTGFSMNPKPLAETMDGKTVLWIKKQANENNFALGGSVIIKDNNNFYNRFIFAEPNGLIRYYDKHHLFSITGENNEYTAGNARTIIKYKGFKFLLQII